MNGFVTDMKIEMKHKSVLSLFVGIGIVENFEISLIKS